MPTGQDLLGWIIKHLCISLEIMCLVQVCAIRQALSKSLVPYNQKYAVEQSKQEIKDILVQFDRSVLNL